MRRGGAAVTERGTWCREVGSVCEGAEPVCEGTGCPCEGTGEEHAALVQRDCLQHELDSHCACTASASRAGLGTRGCSGPEQRLLRQLDRPTGLGGPCGVAPQAPFVTTSHTRACTLGPRTLLRAGDGPRPTGHIGVCCPQAKTALSYILK